jgi:phosphodiesterase/alkaline phosphatase D-like protein
MIKRETPVNVMNGKTRSTITMAKAVLFFVVLCMIGVTANAQTIRGNYLQTKVTGGTFLTPGTTTSLFGANWVGSTATPASVTIPFSFNFLGTNYTTCYVNPNGYITFGAASVGTNYTPLTTRDAGVTGVVSALAINSLSSANAVTYGVTGTAPYRVFSVIWTSAVPGGLSNSAMTFEINLFETTNKAEVMYGSFTQGATAATVTSQVGIAGTTVSDYLNWTEGATSTTTTAASASGNNWALLKPGISTTATCTLLRTSTAYFPANGLTLDWTPNLRLLSPSSITNTDFTINWLAPATTPSSYTVEVSTSSTIASNITGYPVTVSGSSLSATVTGLTTGTKYYYRVTPVYASTGLTSASVIFPITMPVNPPISINSGFNFDIVADGGNTISGSGGGTASFNPGSVTNITASINAFDHAGNNLCASDFYNSGTTNSLPIGGSVVETATGAVKGTTYQLAPYFQNNCFWFQNGTLSSGGTLNFTTPFSATTLYVLSVCGNGSNVITYTVNFSDGTTQAFTSQALADWCASNTQIGSQITRLNATDAVSLCPYLYRNTLAISSANYSKMITGLSMTLTGGSTSYPAIFAVSAQKVGVLTPSVTSLSGFSVANCATPSTAQSFTLTGSSLVNTTANTTGVGGITVTAPLGYKISKDNVTFVKSDTVQFVNCAIPTRTLYVKLDTFAVGTYSGNITFTGGSVPAAFVPTVTVTGTVTGVGVKAAGATSYPASLGTVNFGNVPVSTSSVIVDSFTAVGLTGDVGLTSSNSDILLSLDNVTYGSTVTLTATGGAITPAVAVYAKATPSVQGPIVSIVTLSGGVPGCTPTIKDSVFGTLPCVAPSVPTTLTFTGSSDTGVTISFTPVGTADGYLLLRGTSPFSGAPVDNTNYIVGNTIGTGTVIGKYNTLPPYIISTGLSPNTTYYYTVIPFNGGTSGGTCTGGPLYPSGNLTGSATTCMGRTGTPTATLIAGSSVSLSWTASTGSPTNYSVEVSTNSSFTPGIIGSPFVTASASISLNGLVSNTTYYVRITPNGGVCTGPLRSASFTTRDNIMPVTIASGFNADIVANGSVAPPSCTSFPSGVVSFDGATTASAGFDFVSSDYTYVVPTYSLPSTGTIVSTATIPGMKVQLASFSSQNALGLRTTGASAATITPYPYFGTLTFATPQYASALYVVGSSANSSTTVNIVANYTDGSKDSTTGLVFPDWYTTSTTGGMGILLQPVGRVNASTGAFGGSATGPMLEYGTVSLPASGYTKKVQSVTIRTTSTTANTVLGVMAVSAKSGTLAASTSSLPAFTATTCTPSTTQTFTIYGNTLFPSGGAIVAKAPTGFQVSADGSTWDSTASFSYTANAMAGSTVYVRLAPSVGGSYSGNITFTGGTVNTPPTIAVTGTATGFAVTPSSTAAFGPILLGATSTGLVYSISGTGLTAGTLTISSSNADFQVSSDSATWGSSFDITNGTTLSATNIYIRYQPTVVGLATANISFSSTSMSCVPAAIVATGTGAVPCSAPSVPTSLAFTSPSSSSVSLGFTPSGSSDAYLVIKSFSAFSAGSYPVSGTNYSVGDTFGNGRVVAVNTSLPPYALTGMNGNTAYYYTVIPLNGGPLGTCAGGPLYPSGSPLTGQFITCPNAPTSPVASSATSSSFALSWTAPTGGSASAITYLVDVSTNNTFTAPVTGSPFSVSGTSTTITGLNTLTTYYYRVSAVGSCTGSPSATGSITTIDNYVTVPIASGFNADVVASGSTSPATSTSYPSGSTSFDNAGFDLIGFPYTYYTGTTTYALPASGLISSTAVSNLKYQLASYTGNNALYIHSGLGLPTTGTLTFSTPISASTLYVLGISGTSTTGVTFTLNYTDGTSESYASTVYTYPDWYTTTSSGNTIITYQGVGRIGHGATTTTAPEGSSTAPNLSHSPITLTAAGQAKLIQSITANYSTGTGYVALMAVSAKSGVLNSSTVALPSFTGTAVGCSSSAQSFTINGSSLFPSSGTVIATAPTGYQVSNNGTTWGSTASFAYTGNTMSSTPVYVRFVPTAAGTTTGQITFSGATFATSPSVSLTGTTSGLGYSPTSTAAFGPVTVGTSSAGLVYALAGTGLTSGTLTITSSNPDFQVSSDSASWGTSYSFANGSTVASNIYIRFSPSATGAATSAISIAGDAVTCALPAITATGNGSAACIAPSVPTSLTFSSTTTNSSSVSFTPAGTPDGYLLVKSFSAFSAGADPVTGHAYVTGDTIGNGRVVGVYTVAPPYAATTLTANTNYYYTVIPYNGGLVGGTCGGGPLYPSGTQLTSQLTTCPAAPTMGTNTVTLSSITLNWLSAVGGNALPVTYTVEVYTDAGYTTPVTGSPFTVSAPATSLTVSGLTSGTVYYYRIKSATTACTSGYTTGTITSGAYCTPTWTAGCSGWRIYSVTMNGSASYTGTCGSSFNQTAIIDTVIAGVSTTHTVVSGSYTGIAIWVDFNNNGSFGDAGEYLFGQYLDGTPATFSPTFTVPTSVTTGNYRMRVLCNWGGGIDPVTGACAAYNGAGGGNYYDFTMYVKNPIITSSATSLTSFGTVNRGCNSASQNFTIAGTGLIPSSGSIVAHAPVGYQVSTDNVTWDTIATYSYTGAVLATSTVYTRFSPTTGGTISGSVTLTGGGMSTPPSVAVTGTGNILSIAATSSAAVYCSGSSALTLSATGGSTYSWTPSFGLSATTGTSVSASPSANVTYTVTGYDAAGCSSSTGSVTVTYNVTTGPISGPSVTLCLPGVMALTEVGTGGAWNTSDEMVATVDANGIVYGVSTSSIPVTVTYSNPTCGGSATYNITVADGGFTVSAVPSSGTYCSTGAPLSVTASGATTYQWTPATGLSATVGATVAASPSASTVYTVVGTTGACSNATTVTVWNTTPGAITGGITSLCTSGTGSTTTWSDTTAGGTWSSSAPTVATITSGGVITALSAGTATITYNVGGCYVTRNLVVNTTPVLSVSPSTASICGGVSITMTASGAATYSWSPSTGLSSAVGATVTASPSANTTYTITGTSAAGCVSTINKSVGVGAGVNAFASVSTASVCPGANDTLSSYGTLTTGTTYGVRSIPFQLVTQTSPTTILASGNDDVLGSATLPFAFNFFGTNYAAGSSFTVSSNGYVQFGSGLTNTTYGATNMPASTYGTNVIALFGRDLQTTNTSGTGSIKGSVEGTAPNRKYVIYYNNVSVYCSGCGTPAYNGQVVLYEGTNVVDVIIEKTASTSHVLAAIQQNSSNGVAAPGRNYVTMQITTPEAWRFAPVLASPVYSWAPSAGLSSSTNASATTTVAATTGYTVTITDASSGCSDTAITTINAFTPPNVTIPTPVIGCGGVAMTANGATTYAWTPSAGLSATTGATVTPSATVAATTYSVIGTDGNGCKDTAAILVNPTPVVTVTPTSAAICAGGNSTLTATGASTYSWTPSATLSSSTDAAVTATPGSTTTYSVVGTSLEGCISAVKTGTVTVNPTPVAGVLAVPSGYCIGSGSPLTINSGTATGTGSIISYNWSGPNSFSTTTSVNSVSFTPVSTDASGQYSLTVTYPGSGCTSAASVSSAVTVANYPVAFNITGGNGCSAAGLTIGTDGSESTVSYVLQRAPSTIVQTLSGTGSGLVFTPVSTVGSYRVIATGPGGCATAMNGADTIRQTPTITPGTMPGICQGTLSQSIGYAPATGSPTTYSIDWSSAANTAGFTDITDAALGTSIDYTIPASGAVGLFTGTITVSNGYCVSAGYSTTLTVYATPTMTMTDTIAPCYGYAGSIEFSGPDSATVNYRVNGGALNHFTFSGTTYSLSTGVLTTPVTYQIVSASNPVCATTYNDTVTITPIPMMWVGGTPGFETDWNTAANWTCGFVPTSSDSVTIPGTVYAPEMPAAVSATVSDLNVASGTVINLNTGSSLNVIGNVYNAGTVAGNGRIILNGSATQKVFGIGTMSNIELNNSNGATIQPASRMMISKAVYLTAGTLTTSDSLELLSTDTFAAARIAEIPSGAGISGKVKTDQYVQGGYRRFRFWGHSFSDTISLSQLTPYIDITGPGGSSNGFTTTATNNPSAFRYDPYIGNDTSSYSSGWVPFTRINALAADSNRLHPGQGIRLFFRGSKGEGLGYLGYYGMYMPSSTINKMIGHVNQGAVSIPLKRGTDNQTYNQLSNPYPSPVDIGTVLYNAKAAGQVTGGAFYVWNPSIGAGGQYMAIPIGTSAAEPYYIQANTSFQVKADHDGAHVDFVESDKAPNATLNLFRAPSQAVRFNIYDTTYHLWDVLSLQFNDKASDAEDKQLDATKPYGPDMNFYSIAADGRRLAIDARRYEGDKVVPLGVKSAYQQDFVIRAESISVPTGGAVTLHDKLLNKYVEMKEGTEYRFTIGKDKSTQGDDRFELVLKPTTAAAVKGLDVSMAPNPVSDDVKITFTSGNKDNVSVRIMDVSGVSIYSQDLGTKQNGVITVPMSNFAAGVYMVEITQGEQKVTRRLVKE